MPARNLLLTLSVLAAVGLAGCADDAPDESADDRGDDLTVTPDSSAMCLEGAEDCDDTPTMETVDEPGYVGS